MGKTRASPAWNGGSIPLARSRGRLERCTARGGLPGLAGAAVGTADRGGDLRLEAVSALAPVQGLILRCRGALGAKALRGSEVLGGRARVTPAGASGDLCGEMH